MSVNIDRSVKTRAYHQQRRAEGAADTRRRLLDAARAEMTRRPMRRMSIDAVAARACVARSTVYGVFGSRSGLFDAVTEDILEEGGMGEIGKAFEKPNPIDAMEAAFPAGSRMYAHGQAVFRALDAMAAIDRSASTMFLRSEERRAVGMRDLAERLTAGGFLGSGVDHAMAEAHLWVVTSFRTFDLLSASGLTPDQITDWMFATTRRTLKLRRLGRIER